MRDVEASQQLTALLLLRPLLLYPSHSTEERAGQLCRVQFSAQRARHNTSLLTVSPVLRG